MKNVDGYNLDQKCIQTRTACPEEDDVVRSVGRGGERAAKSDGGADEDDEKPAYAALVGDAILSDDDEDAELSEEGLGRLRGRRRRRRRRRRTCPQESQAVTAGSPLCGAWF